MDCDIRVYVWRYGGQTVYCLNVKACSNNVLAFRAVGDEDTANHWLGMMSEIVEIMKNAIAQCL